MMEAFLINQSRDNLNLLKSISSVQSSSACEICASSLVRPQAGLISCGSRCPKQ